MATKIVKRGYVVVFSNPLKGYKGVTAVVSRKDAEGLQKRVGGKIMPAAGYAYRYAQGTLRVLTDPASIIRRSEEA